MATTFICPIIAERLKTDTFHYLANDIVLSGGCDLQQQSEREQIQSNEPNFSTDYDDSCRES